MTAFSRTDTSLLGRWWWTVDRWSLGALLALVLFGIVMTLAASPAVAERLNLDTFYFARRQLSFLPVAVGVMLFASLLSPVGVRRIGIAMFIVFLGLTLATPHVGVEIKGATRWLHVGGLSLQPSEFLKPAFAVTAAWLIAAGRMAPRGPGYPLATVLLAATAGALLLQPDVGMALMITAVWMTQLFLIGLPVAIVIVLVALVAAGGVGAYYTFGHVRSRVDNFIDPASGSDGYQVARSLEAFRSGGLLGRGPGEGRVKEVLPDAHSDFILAVVGEEFGIIACLLLIAVFAFVVVRGFGRSLRHDNLFVVLAAAGLLVQFGLQALVNMASTVHLIPPKGITLPFVSYGGSSTIALAWGMGMMLALTRERAGMGMPR
ncbi:MAG: cell division protein FtsW [Rhodospirillales bacterium]|nr:MAG: cell division protein FtsW [Rhodospirillales bacterium]